MIRAKDKEFYNGPCAGVVNGIRNASGRTIVTWVFGCFCALVLLMILHTETYVWQSVTLGHMIRPVHRTTCDITHTESPSLKDFPNAGEHHMTSASNTPPTGLRIGMLMLYDNIDSWGDALINEVVKNRKAYCDKHGYTLVTGNDAIDPSRPAAWSKLLAIEKYLPQFDYVFYIDMDVVIMRMDQRLETFIGIASGTKKIDFIMTADWNGPNTGVFFVKNSGWSLWFLRTAWVEGINFLPKKSPNGISHPFQYEQRSFHYLLNTEVWQERGLPEYPGDSEAIREHFSFLPQCSFNSYSLHPLDTKGEYDSAGYIEGDFLIHFAGKKQRKRSNLMWHFIAESKENMKTDLKAEKKAELKASDGES